MGVVPLPRALARFNKHITNPLAMRIPRLGPLSTVVHRGRRSNREYRTPVAAFPCGDAFAIPLPYGRGTDWVRNVEHAGTAILEFRNEPVAVFRPRIVGRSDAWDCLPLYTQPPLRFIGTSEFLLLRRA
jgi:deazaflavin-dependent oxidoreductase (nitroreductase family)